MAADLLSEICARYEVGPAFARAYVDHFSARVGAPLDGCRLDEVLARPQPEPLWFDFALSTNQRARTLWQTVAPHVGARRGRYLDVGTGYGGTLITFRQQGFDVHGVEIVESLARLARANLRDAGLDDVVLQGSIVDEALVARLGPGRFDLITCIDVIEHVSDPWKALRHMVSLLAPGGLLLLEIPNKDSLSFVVKDGHFGLFGITQLPRRRAEAYYARFFREPYDGMGEYFPLSSYLLALEAAGCEGRTIDAAGHYVRPLTELPALFRRGRDEYRAFLAERAPRLPLGLTVELHAAVARYLGSFAAHRLAARLGLESDAAFRGRYLADFWTVLARKRTSG